MKKVYYTGLSVISLSRPFLIQYDDVSTQVEIAAAPLLMHAEPYSMKELLYKKVKDLLGTDQFFLIPSSHEVELQAYMEDQMEHPEKYPNCGCSVGFGKFGYKCEEHS